MRKLLKMLILISYTTGIITLSLAYLIADSRICLVLLLALLTASVAFCRSAFAEAKFLTMLRGKYYALKCGSAGKGLRVGKNTKLLHPECLEFGQDCVIGEYAAFCPLVTHSGNRYSSKIQVGNNVNFGAYDRIASMNSVTIEDDVLFAAFVHITDHSHQFQDVSIPVCRQSVYTKGPVVIKKGAWLAFGCHILSGVTVGEHSVVAANSVVVKDVPPYSVVAGNPARLVKQYNFETKKWDKVGHS